MQDIPLQPSRSYVNAAVIIALAMAASPQATPAREGKINALDQWPAWRGPLGTGVAPNANPPVSWSESENVRWKVALPGKGHSTPVVWGNRVFVTTAIRSGDALSQRHQHAPGAHDNVPASHREEFVVIAINRLSGEILWKRTVNSGRPHESMHETASWASNSPVTDGERVFAYFGSRGLYCLDYDGTVLWQSALSEMHTKHGHGEGSSPALFGNTLVVNWDHEGESFVMAFDKRTGERRWKVPRDEATSWSTPLIVDNGGKPQVVVAATKRVRAYDLANGSLIWECGGLSGNVVASPVAAEGIVYVANSYETRAMVAIRLEGAKGDITGTDAVVWTHNRDTPYVPSPLLYGDLLFFLKHYQGFVTCLNAKTGETHFGPERLSNLGNVYSSLVGAADRVYIAGINGTTIVLSRSTRFEMVARNSLSDSFSASPAIAGNELFLRGERNLYCIAEESAN